MTVLLVLVVLLLLSPSEVTSDRTRGHRSLDDIVIVILVLLGLSAFVEHCPGRYYYYY